MSLTEFYLHLYTKMTTHGESRTRLYSTWNGMTQRCYNPNRKNYKYYGGSGVTICNKWRKDYTKFRDWALAHYKNDKPIQRYIDLDWFRLVMHEWKRQGRRRYEPRFLITQRGFNGMIDLAIRERVIDLPIPKTYCLPYLNEPLASEEGRLT